jgi:hypothetical protein
MDVLQHRLTQYKGSPGQGSTVKCALDTHHLEIKKLMALVAALQAQVAKLELTLMPEPEPEAIVLAQVQVPQAAEKCAPILVVAALAPVAAAVIPVVAAAISSKPAALRQAAESSQPEVVGHYSVSTTPASSGNDLPIPATVPAAEEGSETDDSVETILLEAEQHSADRFMSLAKHQQATTAKVRAAAARKRVATPRKKATL